MKWLKDGDMNTSSILCFGIERLINLSLLVIDGVAVSDPTVVQQHVLDFYQSLLFE